ncbi:MAG: RDD family protein [Microthrixaceae bacterium]
MASPSSVIDPTAVFGRRVVAALIDAALILIPAILLVSASFEYLSVDALNQDPQAFCDTYIEQSSGVCLNFAEVDDRVYFADSIDGTSSLYYWGATLLLLVVLQGLTGATPGKLLVGIRTVREDGRRPGLVKAFVRWILWVVDAFPYLIPLLGFIVGLTTQGHRRVGDMVAKTYVVRRAAAGSPIVVPGAVGAFAAPVYTPMTTTGGAPASTLSATGPQWDVARNTYIQWDPAQSAWFQWDQAAQAWTPISGG